MNYLNVGVCPSPGNVPVYHGSNLKVSDRRVRLSELVLRCVISGLAILSAVFTVRLYIFCFKPDDFLKASDFLDSR